MSATRASAALVIGIAPITAKALNLPTAVTEEGKNTYKKYYSACHGEEGKETDLLQGRCFPKPRDFTRVLISSEQPQVVHSPTDEDIYRTISMAYQILP